MGAILSAWDPNHKSEHYGRAKVRDWKTMMEWIKPLRNKGWNLNEKEEKTDGSGEPTERATHIKHRRRCIAWLLNSMARGISFDKEKANTYAKWRFEFARVIPQGTSSTKLTNREAAVREAVNTLTLGSLTMRQVPADNIFRLPRCLV